MRYLILFLFGCSVAAQQPNKDLKNDAEFEQLIKKVEASAKESVIAQSKADEQQKKIVTEAVNKIVNLKKELNEAKAIIDSINVDTGSAYIILPISNH
jgi:ADP-heptose:LPS heptosyltransferase